jgi:predicted nucleotidyltransferase component of viral defense system
MESLILKNPHWEALTSPTQEAFHLLDQSSFIRRFYLAGGTGLALHLGHRFSIDLDYFSSNPSAVGAEERVAIRETLFDPTLEISTDADGTFVALWRGVGTSFFRLDLYPLVTPTYTIGSTPLASLEEIGAMKLAAIIGRGNRKDLVDLYFILQQVTLDTLFETASRKYAQVRTFAISATRALAYFEDAENLPMPQMLDHTPWPKMKRFLENQAIEAGRKHLQDLWM